MTIEEAIERAASALEYRATKAKEDASNSPKHISELLLEGARNDEAAVKVLQSLPF